jgi:penicillin-insensitive murein endopeptidase
MTAYRLIASCVALAACAACGAEPSASRTPQVSTAVAPAARARNAASDRASSSSTSLAVTAPTPVAPAAVASPSKPLAAPDPVAALLALRGEHSTSLGAPGNGSVRGAVALPERGPGFVHNVKRPAEARYGTVEIVQAIVRAAAVVERELPGSGLVVNDIGLDGGGPIRQHGSHQSGRDADILFYLLDRERQPLPAVGVPIEPDGTGYDYKDLSVPADDVLVRLDAPRTWRFMQALIEDPGAQVQRIFLVEHVRAMLLAAAEKQRAPQAARDRFAALTCQPGTPHDDHMHVRWYCTPEDIGHGCYDTPPIYPWQRDALAVLGLAPVLEPPGRRARRSAEVEERTTSRAEARAKAGPMHKSVRQFLARREAWASQPHPGREYCK